MTWFGTIVNIIFEEVINRRARRAADRITQSCITRASQRLPDIGSRNAPALGEMPGNASPHFAATRNSCPAGGQLTLRPGAVVRIARFSPPPISFQQPLLPSHDMLYVRSSISHLHSPLPDSYPLQSSDGKRLYLCSGDEVRSFCSLTGAPLGTRFVGYTAEVTGVAFHPGHPGGQILLSASLDGTIRTWNSHDGSPGAILNAPGPVESMAVPSGKTQHSRDLVFISCWQRVGEQEGDHAEGGRVYSFNLSKGRSIDRLVKTAAPPTLNCSPDGAFLGAFDRHTVMIWPLLQRDVGQSLSQRIFRLHHTKPITVLAFDQSNNIVAAGDSTGRILLWHGFGRVVGASTSEAGSEASARGDLLPCTTFHWHAQAIGCLSFSADGAYLLSGGSECVLVRWQLEDGKRSYLPRLGSPLRSISQFPNDASRVAISGADNTVRVVSLATMSVENFIRGVRPAFLGASSQSSDEMVSAILAGKGSREQPAPAVSYDPQSGAVAFATVGATLQMYDHVLDRHVANLEVAPRNIVSGDGGLDQKPMEPYVSHAAFSKDGSILVTVDRRSERPMTKKYEFHASATSSLSGPEETLRIWERRRPQGSAIMEEDMFESTCVSICEAPHIGLISSVVIRGNAGDPTLMACTVSLDGDIKMWIPSGNSRGGERSGWRCYSVLTHMGIPAPPLHAAAFSQDDSLLATASTEVVLWDPETCARLNVLTPPKWTNDLTNVTLPGITAVAFIAGEPLLAAASPEGLVVWNLVTLTAWRTIALPCTDLVSHSTLPHFTVTISPRVVTEDITAATFDRKDRHTCQPTLTRGSILVQFGGSSASPIGCWGTPGGSPQAVIYPCSSRNGVLVITHDRRIISVGDTGAGTVIRSDSGEKRTRINSRTLPMDGHLRAFEALTPRASVQNDGKTYGVSMDSRTKTGKGVPWGELFDSPSHVLPPLTTLAPHFLDALLQARHTT